jgi:hypothetical protein
MCARLDGSLDPTNLKTGNEEASESYRKFLSLVEDII